MSADLYLAFVLFVFTGFGATLAWVDFSGRHLRRQAASAAKK